MLLPRPRPRESRGVMKQKNDLALIHHVYKLRTYSRQVRALCIGICPASCWAIAQYSLRAEKRVHTTDLQSP
jgi:hypothetical protein